MNPTTTTLEQQFPLSPKKFWKKFLLAPPVLLLSLIGSVFLWFMTVIVESSLNPVYQNGFASPYMGMGICIGVLFFLVSTILSALYIKAYIKRYYYSTDTDFITIKKGVLAPKEIHVQYSKIQDVYVDQDIYDRMLGLYDVHIASATSNSAMEAHIDGVDAQAAQGLKNLFLNSIRNKGQIGTNPQAIPAPVAQPTTVNLPEAFSNVTYPISSRWVGISIVRGIFHWLIIIAIALIVPSRTTGNNLIGYLLDSQWPVVPILIVLGLVIVVFQMLYAIIWKSNYKFEFTPEYIFTHESVVSTKEAHTPYSTIQDVIVSQGLMDKIFGIYTVTIQNAVNNASSSNNRQNNNTGIKIPGQSFESATKISNFLKSVLASRNTGQTGL